SQARSIPPIIPRHIKITLVCFLYHSKAIHHGVDKNNTNGMPPITDKDRVNRFQNSVRYRLIHSTACKSSLLKAGIFRMNTLKIKNKIATKSNKYCMPKLLVPLTVRRSVNCLE